MISADELRRLEAKCNALLAADEDYRPLVRAFEEHSGVHLRAQRIRRVWTENSNVFHLVLTGRS
jgi:hypothetical protein